jgi:TonB family protein
MKNIALALLLTLIPESLLAQGQTSSNDPPVSYQTAREWNASISSSVGDFRLTDEVRAKGLWGQFLVRVRFSATPDGKVTSAAIEKSSGHQEIDRMVEETFREAQLAPFSPDMPQSEMPFSLLVKVMIAKSDIVSGEPSAFVDFKFDTVDLKVEINQEPAPIVKITEVYTRPCFSPGQARQHVIEIAAENITDLNIIQIQGLFAIRVSLDLDALPDSQFSTTSTCDGNVYTSPIKVSALIVLEQSEYDAIKIQELIGKQLSRGLWFR